MIISPPQFDHDSNHIRSGTVSDLISQVITHPLIFARFYWLLYVTWCKSLDSYHAITLPASIFVLRLITSVEKNETEYVQGKKQTSFEKSGDIDIKKLVANAVPESAKKSTK